MSFEESLLRGIPQDEASSFFLRIRGRDKQASTAELDAALAALPVEERRALVKSAAAGLPVPGKVKKAMNMPPAAGGAAGAQAALPATAKGQNMQPAMPPALPPTAMGQNTSPGMKMAASDKSPEETGKERARASLSAEFEKDRAHRGETRSGLAGGTLGAIGGGIAAHRYGKSNPLATIAGAALGHHLGKGLGRAAGAEDDARRHAKHGAAFKVALQDTGLAPQGIVPQLDPETQQLLALQQEGDAAAEQGESAYLRQQLEALRQESAASMEQAQTLQAQQQQNDALTAAMQAQVADATQKSMDSQDQVLQQQQAAAAMRMAFQELRGRMLEAASAEPPSLTPSIGSQAAAAQASQQAGASSAPAPTAGPAGQAPNPGVPPAGMAPTGDDTVSTPAEKNEPTFEGASSTTSMNQKEPSGDAKTPNKEVLASASRPLGAGGKTASLRELLKEVGTQGSAAIRARAPYAAGGALIGAGLGAGEAFSSNEPLRAGVAELEAKPDRGYADTLNLAQKKARLTVGEFAKKHPAAMMGIGALGGMGIGASEGPGTMQALRHGAEHVKGIGQDLKTLYQGAA